ncbi:MULTISPECIES: DsbA family protein [Vibrio]|uniref:DsbA family protein n=1 Tax=Vibrio TaxID=662 RepID=UPI00078D54CD|nr:MULTISPECIES: DsbA family protein [Vibrio]BAU70812.1 hypothetical protein [Vibrio sp. 04Ya108]BBM67619.1 hypothetical protein VA249_42650 [Vibrio alfacsensis]BCN27102.1 hypothetical protein VYA_42940 [Vibrio alfacsensis]
MKKSTTLLALTVSAILSTSVFANAAAVEPESESNLIQGYAVKQHNYEPLTPSPEVKGKIMDLVGQFVTSISFFKGPYDLIALHMVTKTGQTVAGFTNQEAEYLMAGSLVDINDQTQHHLLVTDLIKPQAGDVASGLESLPYAAMGTGDELIHVVVDVNCPYCHQTYEDMEKLVNANPGKYQVRYYAVGFLGADSTQKAERLAGIPASERSKAFSELMKDRYHNLGNYQFETNDGNVRLYDFMKTNGFSAVPIVISEVSNYNTVVRGKPSGDFYRKLNTVSQ